nr:DUF1129 family protein [Jeotgalibacillus terrae]
MRGVKAVPELSKESRRFIDDLKLYLFSSGKKDEEIREIAEELETHLEEAERNGKPVEQVVGSSPKEYMEMISNEMAFDKKAWLKYIPVIIFGAISFTIIGQLVEDMRLSYSYAILGGSALVSILFVIMIFGAFKYMAARQMSRVKEFLITLPPVFIMMTLFGALVFWDMTADLPGFDLNVMTSMIVGVVTIAILIWVSIWAKTAVLLVMLSAIHVPELLLKLTTLDVTTSLIINLVAMYLIIGLYMYFSFKKMKKAEAA